jgi:uncharacterized protein YpmB
MNKKIVKIVIGILVILIVACGVALTVNYGISSNIKKSEIEANIDDKENDSDIAKESYFYGKVVQSEQNFIMVEPNEGEDERKTADKFMVGLGDYNDCLYEVGTNVK